MTYPEHSWHQHYVYVRSGKRTGLMLGPYATRADAAAHVDRARDYVTEVVDPFAWGYEWGTCRVELRTEPPVGKLNDRIGLAA